MSGCRRCAIDVTHCHGTLVRHDDESWECSAADCSGDLMAHDFVLACGDEWAGCCGSAPFAGQADGPGEAPAEGGFAGEWAARRAG